MDERRFAEACAAALSPESRNGIGTLGEKTLHAVLKRYLEPDPAFHEIEVAGFVADICRPDGIIEIQTRSLDKLTRKLPAFLERGPVRVVYPIPCRKTVSWVDPATGEATPPRRSPKTGTPCDAFRELYRLRAFLPHPDLRVQLLLIDMAEYRYLNGWSADRKRGSSRCDRIPQRLAGEILLHRPEDFARLIPPGLPQPFTAAEFQKAARVSPRAAGCGLALLGGLGLAERCGRRGRAYLYRTAKEGATQ